MLSEASLISSVECVWAARAVLREGPCWDLRSGRLLWVDMKSGQLHAFRTAEGARQSWTLPCRICSLDVPYASWRPPASARRWREPYWTKERAHRFSI